MEFDAIKEAVRKVGMDTMRVDNKEYFEAVVVRANLDALVRALEDAYGVPAWPSHNKLSKDVEKLIKNVGGLRKGQTLYFSDKDGSTSFAMLWPWQDGERITIKISKS